MSPRDFVFDPRTMILPPYRTCPKCGQADLGTLMVSRRYIVRRCRACRTDVSALLPPVRKALVYLDQMVLSNIAKSLDPIWRATRGAQDPFWVELFDVVDRLLKLQLLVCPESRTHEQESVVLPHWPVLRRLYEHLANGVRLEFPLTVYQIQLHHALEADLEGAPVDYAAIERGRMLSEDPNQWMDRRQIRVNFGTPDEDVRRYRRSRDGSGEAFATIHARWASQSERRFGDWYAEERRGMADAMLDLYIQHLRLAAAMASKDAPYPEALWNPRMEVDIVDSLLRRLESVGVPPKELPARLDRFLYAEATLDAPWNDISALLMAALAKKAAAGQRKRPNRGTSNDINTIASYLPYVDAIFIDDQFAGLMREEPLKSRLAVYSARVFSNRTRGQFLEYLRGLEDAASPEHVALVHEVYGDGWLTPYRTILEDQREREAERSKATR